MRWIPAALVMSVAAVAAGCGDEATPAPAAKATSQRAVKTNDYVASPTLTAGSAGQLFAIPGLGRFRASCKGEGRAVISYRASSATSQLVTTEGGAASSNGWLDPGQSMAVGLGREIGPRVEWQVAVLSKGRIEVASAAFTVGTLPGSSGRGCLVSAKAEVTKRPR